MTTWFSLGAGKDHTLNGLSLHSSDCRLSRGFSDSDPETITLLKEVPKRTPPTGQKCLLPIRWEGHTHCPSPYSTHMVRVPFSWTAGVDSSLLPEFRPDLHQLRRRHLRAVEEVVDGQEPKFQEGVSGVEESTDPLFWTHSFERVTTHGLCPTHPTPADHRTTGVHSPP